MTKITAQDLMAAFDASNEARHPSEQALFGAEAGPSGAYITARGITLDGVFDLDDVASRIDQGGVNGDDLARAVDRYTDEDRFARSESRYENCVLIDAGGLDFDRLAEILNTATTIFLVNAGMDYYPDSDNTKAVRSTRESAEAVADELRKLRSKGLRSLPRYDWVEIVPKMLDGTFDASAD